MEAFQLVTKAIETNPLDIPFFAIYSVDFSQSLIRADLRDCIRVERGHSYTPITIASDSDISNYSEREKNFIGAVLRVINSGSYEIFDLTDYDLPKCTWDKSPKYCIIHSIASSGHGKPLGVLVMGVSPHLVFSTYYWKFFSYFLFFHIFFKTFKLESINYN